MSEPNEIAINELVDASTNHEAKVKAAADQAAADQAAADAEAEERRIAEQTSALKVLAGNLTRQILFIVNDSSMSLEERIKAIENLGTSPGEPTATVSSDQVEQLQRDLKIAHELAINKERELEAAQSRLNSNTETINGLRTENDQLKTDIGRLRADAISDQDREVLRKYNAGKLIETTPMQRVLLEDFNNRFLQQRSDGLWWDGRTGRVDPRTVRSHPQPVSPQPVASPPPADPPTSAGGWGSPTHVAPDQPPVLPADGDGMPPRADSQEPRRGRRARRAVRTVIGERKSPGQPDQE